ncbi:uncharacterized protein C1orf50 homolog [Cephus cinctus]|uniref:Uncharacterized protein C1orf50 homolog n=1 Tax=Cephus cinctus TaxID=211228 RepID=A0AAJ7FNB0_CEPCN|nr:uncharacterized protein C1orf50 homolog [Cephus cinctus]
MKRSYMEMEHSNSSVPNKVVLVERNVTPQGIPLLNPTIIAKKGSNDLVELAIEIQQADNYVKANVCNKLQMIAQQMNFLKKQAETVLKEAKQNSILNHAACNFIKHPGHVYHLYQRESGQIYFSMLSPEEWGASGPPHRHKGSFRLEYDRSWTPLSDISTKDNELTIINKFLQATETSMCPSIIDGMIVDS